MKKKVKLRYDRIAIFAVFCFLTVFLFIKSITFLFSKINPKTEKYFLASISNKVNLYDKNKNKIKEENRGQEVFLYVDTIKDEYSKVKYQGKNYYVKNEELSKEYSDVVLIKDLYVRTATVLLDGISVLNYIPKGSKVEVLGFDEIDNNGNVFNYKVKYNNQVGYVNEEYLVGSKEESLVSYDQNGNYLIHKARTSSYGGNAGDLDFYPRQKGNFQNNKMPDKVRALYLNGEAIYEAKDYIEIAKDSQINAFVVNIKDDVLSYKSEVAKEFSLRSYNNALGSIEKYKQNIELLKNNGYYLIGRISVFKDYAYALDNPNNAITDKNGDLYKHNGSYWPSAYNTNVWEYNLKLALEAIELFGFNEIQFDYVRFPDGTSSLEKDGVIDMKNNYNISKIQAIQTFLMYATDILHQKEVYVSADVFGESAHTYVNSYGQYWGAISNVVDVISAMPYPDHFNINQYGIEEPVWTNPYKLLYTWSKDFAMKRQSEIPTPAIMRTWIQAYNTTKTPAVEYNAEKIKEQIKGLEDGGAVGGYMTWNSVSSKSKYREIANSM